MAKQPETKVKFSVFNKEFNEGMREMGRESSTLRKEFKLQEAQLKQNGSETDKLKNKLNYLSKEHEIAKQRVQATEEQLAKAQAQYGENSEEARKLNDKLLDMKKREQDLANEVADTTKQLEQQESKADKLGESFDRAGEKMKKAGGTLTKGLTAPLGVAAAAGIAAFNEVDKGLDTVITKTGATGETLDELKQSFRNVAGNLPTDMETAGEAVGEVNTQFGFMGEELEKNSELMIKFSEINGQDVTSSAINAKQAIEAYGLANEDLSHVLDSVTSTAQATGQSTDALFKKAIDGAPQIKALGLDFAQGTALMGNFEKAGVDSTATLTALTKAQVNFAKDGKTLQEGLNETIDKIKNAESETEALNIATEVFGTKGATKMIEAIERGTFNLEDFATAGENAAGTVANTFAETVDPLDEAKQAMNNAKLIMADLGETILISIQPALQKLIEILQKANEWFSNLSPAVKQLIVIFGAILAAIGPLLVGLGFIVQAIGSLIPVVLKVWGILSKLAPVFNIIRTALMALTGPVGIVIAIITALAIIIYKNWDAIKEATIKTFNTVKTWLSETWSAIKEAISTTITNIFNTIKTMWEKAKNTTVNNFNTVKSFLSNTWNTIKSTVTNLVEGIKNTVRDKFQALIDTIKDKMNNAKSRIEGIWNNVMSFFKGINLFNIGSDIIQGLINGIKNKITALQNAVKDAASAITSKIKNVLGINSPSRVFMEIGEFTGEGLAVGMEKMKNTVSKASDMLAQHTIPDVQTRTVGVNEEAIQEGLQLSVSNNQPMNITVISELDGYEVARNQYSYINDMIGEGTQGNLRVMGVKGNG